MRVFFFYREKTSAFSSLVDSRRILPTHAAMSRRSQQVRLACYLSTLTPSRLKILFFLLQVSIGRDVGDIKGSSHTRVAIFFQRLLFASSSFCSRLPAASRADCLYSFFSTARDPQGSSRVDIITHPYPTIACAARVVTGTAGRDRTGQDRTGQDRTTRAVVTTGTEGYNYT